MELRYTYARALSFRIELLKYGYEHCDVVIAEGIMYDEWYSPLFTWAIRPITDAKSESEA